MRLASRTFRRSLLCIAAGISLASPALAVPINSNLVLKLDPSAANVTLSGVADGPNGQQHIPTWADNAALGGTTNATQGSNLRRPEYFSTVASLNNQSALRFAGSGVSGAGDPDGQSDEMSITGIGSGATFSGNAATLFVAAQVIPHTGFPGTPTQYTIYDSGSGDNHWNFSGGSGYSTTFRTPRFEGTLPVGGAAQTGSQVFDILSEVGNYSWIESGTSKGSSAAGSFHTGANHLIGNSLAASASKAFEGYVAEVLTYNRALNGAERSIVGNYLSAKYNITIAAGYNHYDGDTALNKDYDFDVFGIGQSSVGNAVLSSENNAGLQITGDGSLGTGEWVLAGHKTAINSINGDGSWARVWYVDKTATDGVDATLTFDYSDAGLPAPSFGTGPWSSIGLLYSPTDPFNFGALGITAVVSGDQVSFMVPNAQLLDGYYTLQAITIPEPSTLGLLGLGAVGMAVARRRIAPLVAWTLVHAVTTNVLLRLVGACHVG